MKENSKDEDLKNKFSVVMRQHSDEKLRQILWKRNHYQPLAVQAAIDEAQNRKFLNKPEDLDVLFPVSATYQLKPESEEEVLTRRKKAENDILYGALWFIGGIVGTMAEIGFIFWGAILFGGIQLLKGINNRF